tara:strand:+ start:74 stop:301 length:228 start_codon:yes stop_codon:yes gene_type:complete
MDNTENQSKRFEEIMDEINSLLEEAYHLLPDSSKLDAKKGWHSDIKISITDENKHLGSCSVSMEKSLREIQRNIP